MYDHKKVEEEILKLWEKKGIYQEVKERNKEGKPFYFCDGPPYVTGQIHPGTGWNKAIKDAVCRYLRSQGYNVRDQMGYDTHGLPIEVKVEQQMKIKNKQEIEEKVGIEKFIQECKKFATKYIGVMAGQFKSVGVWMDYDDPYITYKDDYIEKSWKTIKTAWEKGLMKEGVYVLPYCYRCETTMANYELEYGEETDPSIYVKFKVKGKENEYLIIWTTTPWTLVANMAVMVHPTITYAKVKVNDEVWIIAKERVEHVLEMAGESGTVLEEISGKKLEGLEYEHPFQDKIKKEAKRKIILSDEFVTTEEGTGLVHCAPGHGPEDFIVGKRYGIEAFSPVDEHGCYTEEAGVFEGKNVREANAEIVELLDNYGVLIKESRVKHRYPHCWRCKTPLIFLTTKQWFIEISKLKEKMIEEAEKVEWHPEFAKTRFKEFVSNAPDWCISRQRYWGIPLPIWKCEKCGKIKVIGSKNELPKKVKELHRPYIDKITLKCEECGGEMKRVPDVLDVWFDSGNAVWASLREGEEKIYGERADLIIEGQDQIRGWFYSLLGSGVVRYNASPYKRLLMHGFFVDEKGEKMSKSLGNFVPLEEILEKYGADSFRLWSLSNTIWEELKFNWTELKEAHADLDILVNLVSFLERFYGNKKRKIDEKDLLPEDKYIISKTNSVLKEYHESMKKYEINKGAKILRKFFVEEISRWYMKGVKDRLNKEGDDVPLETLYYSVFMSLKMISPFSPFVAEYLYQKFFKKFEKEESIFFHRIDEERIDKIDTALEKLMGYVKEIVSSGLNARQKAKVKLRWPLQEIVIETKAHEVKESVKVYEGLIKKMLNVKACKVVEKGEEKGYVSDEFSLGRVLLNPEITEELYKEAIFNEVKRRIQMLRKKAGLVEKEKATIYITGEKELEGIIKDTKERMMEEVNAKDIKIEEKEGAEKFIIDGRQIKIKVRKVD